MVDLFLRVDPVGLTVTASATVDGGPPIAVGDPQPVPAAWFGGPGTPGPAAGLISTSAGPMPPHPATWAYLEAVAGYLRNLLVVLSARTLPPVWQVGQ